MDPITTAVVAALAAGAASGTSTVAEQAVSDAYTQFKKILARNFGKSSELVKSVEHLEENPASEGRKLQLSEAAKAQAQTQPDVLQAAQALLDTIKTEQPNGERIVQQAYGNNIAQAEGGSTASVDVRYVKENDG